MKREDLLLERNLDFSEIQSKIQEIGYFQPLFSCVNINLEKVKSAIEESSSLFEENLKNNEIILLNEKINSDKIFNAKYKKFTFFLDDKYSIKINNLLKNKNKLKKKVTKVNILTKNNENAENLNLKLIFPINSAKLYLNGIDLIKKT